MTTYSEDFSPLIDSNVHIDVTAIKQDKTHTTFVYFAFVQYDTNVPHTVALFGADHNCIGIPNHRANDHAYVMQAALDAISMRFGDTDQDYFDNYTESELEFCHSFLCEALSGEYESA